MDYLEEQVNGMLLQESYTVRGCCQTQSARTFRFLYGPFGLYKDVGRFRLYTRFGFYTDVGRFGRFGFYTDVSVCIWTWTFRFLYANTPRGFIPFRAAGCTNVS